MRCEIVVKYETLISKAGPSSRAATGPVRGKLLISSSLISFLILLALLLAAETSCAPGTPSSASASSNQPRQPQVDRVTFPGPVVTARTSSNPMLVRPRTISSIAANQQHLNKTQALRPETGSARFQLGGKCALKSSCIRQASSRRLETDASADKLLCHCDKMCRVYDDCCHDSRWAQPMAERAKATGRQLRQRHQTSWRCKRINPIFGDILLKANCDPNWPSNEKVIRQKCEQTSDPDHDPSSQSSDPMGSLMPITDLANGITYANSYCLRCNTLSTTTNNNTANKSAQQQQETRQRKLTYWTPLVTCSYNLDSDDRNTLYDLVSVYHGQALKYSAERNKWLIRNTTGEVQLPNTGNSTELLEATNNNNNSKANERECQITPTIPDSIEHMIRFCHSDLIDYCPSNGTLLGGISNEEEKLARFECEHGHQSLVFSQTSQAVYYNLACAKCHRQLEQHVFCEPKLAKDLDMGGRLNLPKSRIVGPNEDLANQQQAPPTTTGVLDPQDPLGGLTGGRGPIGGLGREAARSGGANGDPHATIGSFSVLMDMSGAFMSSETVISSGSSSSNSDKWTSSGGSGSSSSQQVGAKHKCDDAERQVYDPFFSTCRDIVCGLNHHFVDGSCVESSEPLVEVEGNTLAAADSAKANSTSQLRPEAANSSQTTATTTTTLPSSDGRGAREKSEKKNISEKAQTNKNTGDKNNNIKDDDGGDDKELVAQMNATKPVAVAVAGQQQQPLLLLPLLVANGTAKLEASGHQEHHILASGRVDGDKSSRGLSREATASSGAPSSSTSAGRSIELAVDGASGSRESRTNSSSASEKGKLIIEVNNTLSGPPVEKKVVAAEAKKAALTNVEENLERYLHILPSSPDDLPQPSARSRRQFAECGKILIEPEHYHLFTLDELRSIWNSRQSASASSEANDATVGNITEFTSHLDSDKKKKQQLHKQSSSSSSSSQADGDLVWALVFAYNLTLSPSQFELVRSTPIKNQLESFNILVCSPFKSDLVDKFHPAMAYLTTCCLVVSIASLSCYLLLYLLSTFDLRPMLVEMTQAACRQRRDESDINEDGDDSNNKDHLSGCYGTGWLWSPRSLLDSRRFRGSRASDETASHSARSQSLSSRGVACLAGALLAAYLLFIMGHKQQQQKQEPNSDESTTTTSSSSTTDSCALIATGTYYFFLLSFNWMFLLSYDIWRTLRLATCCLRAPSTHTQSKRFIVYAIGAFLIAGIVASLAFSLDQIEYTKQSKCLTNPGPKQSPLAPLPVQAPKNCSALETDLERLVQMFKPKFGQRPGSCWFSNKRSLALFFGLPVAFITIVNLIFFLHSSFMVIKTASGSSRRLISHQSSAGSMGAKENQVNGEQQRAKTAGAAKEVRTTFNLLSNNDLSTDGDNCKNMTTKQASNCVDFTQQNNLTTSSFASVQTIQSSLDLNSNLSTASRRNSIDSNTSSASHNQLNSCCSTINSASESQPSSGYNSSSDAKNSSKEQYIIDAQLEKVTKSCEDDHELHQKPSSSLSSASSLNNKFTATKTNILNKCDLQLNTLGALISSLIKDYRLYCRLSTIMGLTWLTGFIASTVDQSEALWYLFVLLNTLQGLFIFIAFGLKRSRLTNLSILFCYVSFRLRMAFDYNSEKRKTKRSTCSGVSTG